MSGSGITTLQQYDVMCGRTGAGNQYYLQHVEALKSHYKKRTMSQKSEVIAFIIATIQTQSR
jgi:hypothetical protein